MNDMIVFCVVYCDLNILKGKVVDHKCQKLSEKTLSFSYFPKS